MGNGVDPDLSTLAGNAALKAALDHGMTELAAVLRRRGAPGPNTTNTPAHK